GRDRRRPDVERRRRELVERPGGRLEHVRIALTAGVPVAGTPRRNEAGVVRVAFLDERRQRPLAAAKNRKARRAIAEHRLADEILEPGLRVAHRFAELLRRQRRNSLVSPAVRRHLMSTRRNLTNDPRLILRDPT